MLRLIEFYINKIKRLRTYRAQGQPAPYKPFLLLAVIDLIEKGAIINNQIIPSPQLVEAFLRYWNLFSAENPRIYRPFFHLKSNNFWHLHAKAGQETVLANAKRFDSMSQFLKVVSFASLDEDLFLILQKLESREAIRQTVIETYFADKAGIIRAAISENQQINTLENLLLQTAERKTKSDTKQIPETPDRSAAFRRVIMQLYNYTCAVCRLRILTLDGASGVDAAHIVPFSVSHDDGIGNGLALCKLHHWAFDKGLISIDDKFCLIVSEGFEESGEEALLLRRFKSQPILLPKQKPFFPALVTIRWHRVNKFVTG